MGDPGLLSGSSVRPVHTYSIVARDAETGQLGVAVQSHAFCVGAVVPWAEAGVGAVATQSLTDVSYGPLGLAMMRLGKTAEEALRGLLESDSQREVRQVAMVDARGGVAVHTGRKCIQAAGHVRGPTYTVQANLMLRESVWGAMASAFERAQGDLAERMMQALEAAEAEGGDIRGRQSAALVVVAGAPSGKPWRDRLFDLRVDDLSEPLPELRRLLSVARADYHAGVAYDLLRDGVANEETRERARLEFERALSARPDVRANPEGLFWYAVGLIWADRLEEAIPYFQQVFAADPIWRDLVPRLVPAGLLPDDPQTVERVVHTA
jgi:uncharacterized Ntn-hydrolase superfamily protein